MQSPVNKQKSNYLSIWRILLATIITLILSQSTLVAHADDFEIDELPDEVSIGEVVRLTGSNLNNDAPIELRNEETGQRLELDYEIEGDEFLLLEIPADIEVGEYRLCRDGCFPNKIRILPSLSIQIVDISPNEIYSNLSTQVTITLTYEGALEEDALFITTLVNESTEQVIRNEADIQPRLVDGNWKAGEATILIAADANMIAAGLYGLRVSSSAERIIGISSDVLTVLPPIEPRIESISPDNVLTSEVSTEYSIKGENLGEVLNVQITGGGLYSTGLSCPSDSCQLNVASANRLEVEPAFSTAGITAVDQIDPLTFRLHFPDGTDISKEVIVLDRTWPRSFSLVGMAIWGLTVGAIAFFSVYRVFFRKKETDFDQLKQPGTISDYIAVLTATVIAVAVLAVCGASVSGTSIPTPMTYLNIVLAIVNTVNLVGLAHINKVFYETLPTKYRRSIMLLLMCLVWIIPTILIRIRIQEYILVAQLVILLASLFVGLYGLNQVNERAREERERLTDEQIDEQVERILWSKGQIDASTVIEKAPFDRVQRAITTFHQNNRARFWMTDDKLSDGQLSFVRAEAIENVNQAFTLAKESSASASLIEIVSENLEFREGNLKFQVDTDGTHFEIYGREAINLTTIPNPFPLILFKSDDAIAASEIDELNSILNSLQMKHRFAILIPFTNEVRTRLTIEEKLKNREARGTENLVILSISDILQILASHRRNINDAFMDAIHSQVDLQIFYDIYGYFGPVNHDMFYGRTAELGNIYETLDGENSVTIMGTRKLGKTSLLHTLSRLLNERGKKVFYADCHPVYDYTGFYYQISEEWRVPEIDFEKFSEPLHFTRLINEINELYPDQELIFLFDEIDRLLAFDSRQDPSEKLFRLFRSQSQKKRAQFVFTGERTILDAIANPQSCFWNFTEPVPLTLFTEQETSRLISRPLSLIGVSFSNEDEQRIIADTIFEYTSGHPTLIQALCKQCLQSLNTTGDRRLTLEIVKREAKKLKYQDDQDSSIIDTFLSQADPVEKAIALQIAYREKMSKTELLQELRELGFNMKVNTLDRGIRYLILGHVIRQDGQSYVIKPNHFSDLLLNIVPYQERIDSLLDEIDTLNEGEI